jgi:TRAP-type C4-dicarboxylate transport system permease small subunit
MASAPNYAEPTVAERVAIGCAAVGVGALMLAIVVVMADIVTRRTLGFSIRGTIDLTQLAQMACVFLALPYVFLRESHVSVDIVTSRMPPGLRRAVYVLGAVLTFALMFAVTWYSFRQAGIQVAQGDKSVTLGIPILAYWIPTLAGMALSSVAAALVIRRTWRSGSE